VTPTQPLTGTLLSTLAPSFYKDLSLLYAAIDPTQTIQSGTTITGVNLSSFQAAKFSGSIWNDVNPDGIRNPPEFTGLRSIQAPQSAPVELRNFPWFAATLPVGSGVPDANTVYADAFFYVKDLGKVYRWSAVSGSVLYTTISGKSGYSTQLVTANAFSVEPLVNGATVQLLDEFGNVVATTATGDRDLNRDGLIQSTYESGYYEFVNVLPGTYTVRQLQQSGSILSTVVERSFVNSVESLQQQFGFKAAQHDSYNFGGRNERWFQSRTNAWFYITPQGAVFEWDKNSGGTRGLVKGRQVSQLSSTFYLNLNLLYSPVTTQRIVQGGQTISRGLGSMRILDSLFASIGDQLS
jgi:hypothetical protein